MSEKIEDKQKNKNTIKDKEFLKWIKYMEIGSKMGCHQMEERSFIYKGRQMPICARCTGVVIGSVIAIILILFKIQLNLTTIFIFLSIMGIDWALQYINVLKSTNIRRLITGILGGLGITYLYYFIIIFFIKWILKL